jgi:GTP-binding protein
MLLGRKDLVRSSGVPGKTQQINYFLINDLFYFVDLPGYGFAKTGQKQREKIRRMILWYLSSGEVTPKKVVLIIDAKVGLAEFDREMIDLLRSQQYSFLVVLNKADKLNNSDRSRVLRDVSAEVGGEDVFLFSARTGMGKDKLLSSLFS